MLALARRYVAASALLVCAGCGGSNRTSAATSASELKVVASALRLEVIDHRPAPVGDRRLTLDLPSHFAAQAQERLTRACQGDADVLDVKAVVATAQAFDVTDARGEMTRVEVSFDFETRLEGGLVLKRGRGQSQNDIPREEASDEELARVLGATALDALERYWGSSQTIESLNRELAAYRRKRLAE